MLPLGWLFLVGVFALLSLDEVGSLHERLSGDPALAVGTPSDDWVALLALPIAAVALVMVAFALANLARNPLPFALLILSVCLFASVPLQEELELSEKLAGEGRPVVEALLEEGSELTAGWLAVCALLLYLGRIPGYDGWHVRRSAVAAAGLGLLWGWASACWRCPRRPTPATATPRPVLLSGDGCARRRRGPRGRGGRGRAR